MVLGTEDSKRDNPDIIMYRSMREKNYQCTAQRFSVTFWP